MELRQYEERDLEAVKSLVDTTIRISYSNVYGPEARSFFHDYHKEDNITSDAKEGYTVVVKQGNTLVGTGTLLGNDIRRVFILPEYQGMGVGRMIMDKLEKKAQENGLDKVSLSASLSAKDFYLSRGYKITLVGSDPVEGGKMLDYYEMEKKL